MADHKKFKIPAVSNSAAGSKPGQACHSLNADGHHLAAITYFLRADCGFPHLQVTIQHLLSWRLTGLGQFGALFDMAGTELDFLSSGSGGELSNFDKLKLEASLLLEGTWDGFSQRACEAARKPWVPAIEAASFTALNYGLSGLSRAGGGLGTAANLARTGLYVAAACDAYGILAPTTRVIFDTWDKPLNLCSYRIIPTKG